MPSRTTISRPVRRGTGPGPRRRGPAALLVPLAVLALTAGCAAAGSGQASSGSPAGSTAPSASARTPTGTGTGDASAAVPSDSGTGSAGTAGCPARVLAGMSERQRAGQLFVVGVATTTDAVTSAGIAAADAADAGGYILYGGSTAAPAEVRSLTGRVSAQLAARAGGVRPFVAVDQEGGQVQQLSGPGFAAIPSALTQGTWATDRLRTAAAGWGGQLRDAGVNVDLAPVVDVVPAALGTANGPIGRYHRQLGSDPQAVAEHAVAVVQGLQSAGIAATAKHFPGLGRVVDNPDTTPGVVDPLTTAGDPALQPYPAVIGAGVRFVMVSSASYPGLDPTHLAVFSPAVIGLLRGTLHFSGLIASDDLGAAAQVSGVPAGRRAVDFVEAGGQVAVVVKPATVVPELVGGLLAAMQADPTVRARVDAAALAVLTAKQDLGLLTC